MFYNAMLNVLQRKAWRLACVNGLNKKEMINLDTMADNYVENTALNKDTYKGDVHTAWVSGANEMSEKLLIPTKMQHLRFRISELNSERQTLLDRKKSIEDALFRYEKKVNELYEENQRLSEEWDDFCYENKLGEFEER